MPMKRRKKIFVWSLAAMLVILVVLVVAIWATTFHPKAVQEELVVLTGDCPSLEPGQSLKAITYNVQYFSGKNHLFWYEGGEDERATPEEIDASLQMVADIIADEDPDIIILQEVDDGSKRTDREDQLAELMNRISSDYRCYTSAFYWKTSYMPHPKVAGSIGQKLAIISKYKIDSAVRYQLPYTPGGLIKRHYIPKRAVLETRLPVNGKKKPFVLLATHLEVASHGKELMEDQVGRIGEILSALDEEGAPWLMGGDFNLLPPGQYEDLAKTQQAGFRPETEIKPLFDRYGEVPSLADVTGPNAAWYTMNLNDPATTGPDRTVDYFFYPESLSLSKSYVRQDDLALKASDHLPVICTFTLPE